VSGWTKRQRPLPGLFYFAHRYSAFNDAGELMPAAMQSNFELCCRRSALLVEAGWHIYSPVSHTHPIKMAHVPFATATTEDRWYAFDHYFIEAIPFAGIILAPGWESSRGCRREKERFEQLERPVLYMVDPHYVWVPFHLARPPVVAAGGQHDT
jgi:hypothetical protein